MVYQSVRKFVFKNAQSTCINKQASYLLLFSPALSLLSKLVCFHERFSLANPGLKRKPWRLKDDRIMIGGVMGFFNQQNVYEL